MEKTPRHIHAGVFSEKYEMIRQIPFPGNALDDVSHVRRTCGNGASLSLRFRYTGWGDTQLRVHLRRLEELEYLLVHRGGRGQSFVYELLFERQGEDGRPVLLGLIDVEKLAGYKYEAKNAASNKENEVPPQRQSGRMAERVWSAPESMTTDLPNGFPDFPLEIPMTERKKMLA